MRSLSLLLLLAICACSKNPTAPATACPAGYGAVQRADTTLCWKLTPRT